MVTGAMADYREQWILLKSYTEYTVAADVEERQQVSFL
jgi:hypothetical protein